MNDLAYAPPSFTDKDGRKVVFVDFTEDRYRLELDAGAEEAAASSEITFLCDAEDHPAISSESAAQVRLSRPAECQARERRLSRSVPAVQLQYRSLPNVVVANGPQFRDATPGLLQRRGQEPRGRTLEHRVPELFCQRVSLVSSCPFAGVPIPRGLLRVFGRSDGSRSRPYEYGVAGRRYRSGAFRAVDHDDSSRSRVRFRPIFAWLGDGFCKGHASACHGIRRRRCNKYRCASPRARPQLCCKEHHAGGRKRGMD